jgi:hypothetical protein
MSLSNDGDDSHAEGSLSLEKAGFATVIRALVSELERHPGKAHSLIELHQRFYLKRRRLYDVTNIFTVIGCGTRTTTNEMTWHGISRILPRLMAERRTTEIWNAEKTLASLFPNDTCVGLGSLTSALLLLFPATGQAALNLRDVSAFFSHDVQRFKTTLCKLYQITLILGALEVTERTDSPCEVRLRAPYLPLLEEEPLRPLAIESLLNRPGGTAKTTERRREEFRKICDKNKPA